MVHMISVRKKKKTEYSSFKLSMASSQVTEELNKFFELGRRAYANHLGGPQDLLNALDIILSQVDTRVLHRVPNYPCPTSCYL